MSSAASQYRVRLANGQEFGPAGRSLLVQWAREGRIPPNAMIVDNATGLAVSVMDEPDLAGVLRAPPTVQPALVNPQQADSSISAIIPYKNAPALIGYYMAIGSMLPLVGIAMGIPAVILGIMGLVRRSRTPAVRGAVHAWIAIVLGGVCTIVWSGALVVMFLNA